MPRDLRCLDAADAVRAAVAFVEPLAAEHGVRIHARAARPVRVRADKRGLDQILLNPLSNAVKYNRDGGTVRVTARAGAGDTVEITVADTGAGIPADGLARLFVPFDRLGAERTAVAGTGLGLTVSKHLAEAMGGTIEVTSEVGRGSTFELRLPAAAVREGDQSPPAPRAAAAG